MAFPAPQLFPSLGIGQTYCYIDKSSDTSYEGENLRLPSDIEKSGGCHARVSKWLNDCFPGIPKTTDGLVVDPDPADKPAGEGLEGACGCAGAINEADSIDEADRLDEADKVFAVREPAQPSGLFISKAVVDTLQEAERELEPFVSLIHDILGGKYRLPVDNNDGEVSSVHFLSECNSSDDGIDELLAELYLNHSDSDSADE